MVSVNLAPIALAARNKPTASVTVSHLRFGEISNGRSTDNLFPVALPFLKQGRTQCLRGAPAAHFNSGRFPKNILIQLSVRFASSVRIGTSGSPSKTPVSPNATSK